MNASTVGISYSDWLEMDIREFNQYIDGFITRREIKMNDDKDVGHLVAGKIAAAVWGDKSFKKPIKEIKLREDNSIESRNRRVLETLKRKGVRPEHLEGMTQGLTR